MSPFEFDYFISEKNGFLVASLVGILEGRCLGKLEVMTGEIVEAEYRKLVLNFRDVSAIASEAIPLLAKLQKSVREKQADLRLCGLKPEVKEKMARAGILRPHEVTDNLQTALQSMLSPIRKVS